MFYYSGIGFRPVEERDLEALRFLRNDPSTWMNLTTVGQINRIRQKDWFERICRDPNVEYYSIVEEEKSFPVMSAGRLLGVIRMDEIDVHNRSIRVGVDIIVTERGKGWGTKTFKAILKYCFDHLGMHRLWLCVLENNDVAIKLYKNSGFKKEGQLRGAIWRNGRWNDYIVMSILEDEYKK